MKRAAIEAMWHTEPAPAAFTLVGYSDQAARETHHAVRIPRAMGLIGTRSLTREIPWITELVDKAVGQFAQAAEDTGSGLAPLFSALRLMAALGSSFIAVMAPFSSGERLSGRCSSRAGRSTLPTP